MATVVTKTVKPSGGDYTSLSAAEAGEQRDLVAADQIARIECYAMTDATAVAVAGWTTDSTRYIEIVAPAGQRHSGKRDTTKYRLISTLSWFQNFVTCSQAYTRFEGLQFSQPNGGTAVQVAANLVA